jgi:Fe2+ transport system protein B
MRRFLTYFSVCYAILTVLLMMLLWQDLSNVGGINTNYQRNIYKWLETWLFWEINYVLFKTILCLIIAGIISGIQFLQKYFRKYS